jgi:bifunctional ADP-heptose synthase (sugar kinase/adenylyltransferase)
LQPVEKQGFALSRENYAKKTCNTGGVLYLPHISRRAANLTDQIKMTATTSALYDAANAAYNKTQAAQAEAFRAAVYGNRDEAAKALASFLAAKAIEFDLTSQADAAADADRAAA